MLLLLICSFNAAGQLLEACVLQHVVKGVRDLMIGMVSSGGDCSRDQCAARGCQRHERGGRAPTPASDAVSNQPCDGVRAHDSQGGRSLLDSNTSQVAGDTVHAGSGTAAGMAVVVIAG